MQNRRRSRRSVSDVRGPEWSMVMPRLHFLLIPKNAVNANLKL